MTAPVDHDLLADYVGGALAGTPEAEQVATLIATSPAWRTAADDLTQALGAVSQELQAFAGYPESMPADIASRFDEFLASPALLSKAAPAPADPLAERSVPRGAPAKARRRLSKWAVPIGALALATAGFFVYQAMPIVSTPMADSPAADTQLKEAEAATSVPTTSTGRDYTRSAPTPAPVAPAVEQTHGEGPVIPLRSGAEASLADVDTNGRLQACLDAVMKVLPGVITLVDYAKFEGRPALVISITSVGQQWMFVAGPSCGINGPDEIFRTPLK